MCIRDRNCSPPPVRLNSAIEIRKAIKSKYNIFTYSGCLIACLLYTSFLTVGTGIGGAVVIDGKLFNGYANRGTELGHVPLIANGEPCACGSVGCLEHYASTSDVYKRQGFE